MAAMAEHSTHNDDVALLMIRRQPGNGGDDNPDPPLPADARTASCALRSATHPPSA
jgi:hypothetical protein